MDDTPATRKSLTTAIASHFRKLRHGGAPLFGVEREDATTVIVSYRPAGMIGEEHYEISVRSAGLGGTFVRGLRSAFGTRMEGEIRSIAQDAKNAWRKSQ